MNIYNNHERKYQIVASTQYSENGWKTFRNLRKQEKQEKTENLKKETENLIKQEFL